MGVGAEPSDSSSDCAHCVLSKGRAADADQVDMIIEKWSARNASEWTSHMRLLNIFIHDTIIIVLGGAKTSSLYKVEAYHLLTFHCFARETMKCTCQSKVEEPCKGGVRSVGSSFKMRRIGC